MNSNDFSPPRDGYDGFEEKMTDLRETIRRHTAESEVPLVELQPLFLASDQQVRANRYLLDGLHPSQAGHDIVAKR